MPQSEIIIQERYLAGNPIRISLSPRLDQSAQYRIYEAGNLTKPIFSGIGYQPDAYNWVEVNISSLFSQLRSEAGVKRFYIALVNSSNMEYGGTYFDVYGGGISKLLYRQLNTQSIFTTKLKNTNENFFLTTRTSCYLICIPENEMGWLFYYAKGHKFYVKVDGVTLAIYDHSANLTDSLTWLYLRTLRMKAVTDLNKWVSEFEIHSDNGYACSILITESKQKSDYALMFRNSWGAWESISIEGEIEFTPKFDEKPKIAEFDLSILDFVKKPQRKEISSIYTAELGYKTDDERLFILDMLQSDQVYFQVSGTNYAASVSTTTSGFASTKAEPMSINVTIELLDSDTNYSPIMEEANFNPLANNNNEEITTSTEADILIQ
jgi:hypothetical protein